MKLHNHLLKLSAAMTAHGPDAECAAFLLCPTEMRRSMEEASGRTVTLQEAADALHDLMANSGFEDVLQTMVENYVDGWVAGDRMVAMEDPIPIAA